jgi:hypothetical protein
MGLALKGHLVLFFAQGERHHRHQELSRRTVQSKDFWNRTLLYGF